MGRVMIVRLFLMIGITCSIVGLLFWLKPSFHTKVHNLWRRTDNDLYNSEMSETVTIKFEVFGKVQGVFFRKYTKKKADLLNLKGWCMNTKAGTVIGEATGNKQPMESFKTYLKSEGSPKSKIQKATISPLEQLTKNYRDFTIVR